MATTLAPLQADPGTILASRDRIEGGAKPRATHAESAGSGTNAAVAAMSRTLRSAIPSLVLGILCLGMFFHEEIAAAVRVWLRSTAYNHCFLVLPIAAYLAWDRRALIRDAALSPAPWLGLAGFPLAQAWLMAERIGFMEARQLIALCFVELLFLAVLGWKICRRFAAPLLCLFFLIPFGAFAVPLLQSITTRFTIAGLDALGVPNYSDGYTIEIAGGTFYVAEACAGLRFLIAALAFGVLYAMLMYRGRLRRAVFVLASLVVPVIANGLRALGIVVLGDVLGSAEAAAADHILYGWIFFSIVLLLLTILGLPFRQEPHFVAVRSSESLNRPSSHASPLLASYAVVLLAVAGPAIANAWITPQPSAKRRIPFLRGLGVLHPGPDRKPRRSCGLQQIAVRVEVLSDAHESEPDYRRAPPSDSGVGWRRCGIDGVSGGRD